jgi:peroxiredoxin
VNSNTKLIAVLAAVAIAATAALALTREEAAPEVRFTALSGQNFATSDLRGKVVLVNFWATSCETCVKEMPMLIETHRRFAPRGYATVAVAMSYDHPNLVADYAQKNALPFRVALDTSGEIAKRFGDVRATPTTFILDRRGRIVKRYLGEPGEAELRALLEKALADPA